MTNSRAQMFLRPHQHSKAARTVRITPTGRWSRWCERSAVLARAPLCYWRELNGSAQARWLKSVEAFHEQAEALQSADIVLPTTDGREIRLRRIIEPRRNRNPHCIDSALSLPERLKSLSKCSVDFAIA